jgi:hypothetical protein
MLRVAAAAGLAVILALIAQAMLDLPFRIRSENPATNYWIVAGLSILAPVLLFLVARPIPNALVRRTGLVAAAVIAIPCVAVSSCAMLEAPKLSERDGSYELLSEAYAGPLAYRLYRTNCGATCAFGLELREERELPLGMKLVSPRWSLYRASEGTVKVEQSAVLVVKGEDVLGKVAR